MEERESNSTSISLQGNDLSYQKLGTGMRADIHYMESDDIHSSTLELEWDMETELEELGTGQFQSDGFTDHHGNSPADAADASHAIVSNQPSTSPKGRFQRLEEEPEYFSHFGDSKPKTSQHFCIFTKTFCTFMFTFLLGILIGYFTKTNSSSNCLLSVEPASSSELSFISEILNNITKEDIEQHYRYFTQISVNKTDSDPAEKIAHLWTSLGLHEVQLVNDSVLLDLPGSSPNTITLSNGQCYYPNGQNCDEESYSQEFLYAAYSANGILEGEVVDVQYGTVEDLQKVMKSKNITSKSIALLKLGVLPLLYKISLLEEIGFGGLLIYIDPCDVPEAQSLDDKSFMVSLKNAGIPFTDSSANDATSWEMKPHVTSLLVQPVTLSLLKKMFVLTENAKRNQCHPLKVAETDHIVLTLNIQSNQIYKNISNSIAFLRGSLLPDRYIILGSPHSDGYVGATQEESQEYASGAAIMMSIISSIMLKVKAGWRPQRTIIFCSWGGYPFGNFGSSKWGKDLHRILTNNAVGYIGLHNPVRGNGSLHSVSSPSLQNLANEVTKKVQASCTEKEICIRSNVSSVQIRGDADFFINKLGIPAAHFVFEQSKTETSTLPSEVFFTTAVTSKQHIDPSFYRHEYIAKLTSEMVLRIASDPVLPFNALDIALEIQKNIQANPQGDAMSTGLMEMARLLRETAQLFQSNEMRPANDPKEREPTRVRMLNDVLQNMEKNFLVTSSPPGYFRNILYKLDGTSTWFSVLQEAQEHYKITKSNETLLTALQEVLNCITSAQLYFKESLHVFETDLDRKD